MDDSWKTAFHNVTFEADLLKKEALNRHDPAFDPWHRRARSVLLKYAPVKIPAFDEIRFASDFFLSKPGEEQLDINDRIALTCDLDLALDLFQQARSQVEEELRFQKSRERFKAAQAVVPEPAATPAPPAPLPMAASSSAPDLQGLSALVEAMDLTRREKDEALEELDRARRALETQPPDWDRIKRTIKFLLDFDRALALKAVPVLLQVFQNNQRA